MHCIIDISNERLTGTPAENKEILENAAHDAARTINEENELPAGTINADDLEVAVIDDYESWTFNCTRLKFSTKE